MPWQFESLYKALHMCFHLFQSLIRMVGMLYLHNLHFVKLVQAVQSAHILAIRARFATEACRVCRIFNGQLTLFKNHIAIKVRHRHFGSRYQIKVICRTAIHLPLFIWQLSCAYTRCLIDNVRRLYFEVTGLARAV